MNTTVKEYCPSYGVNLELSPKLQVVGYFYPYGQHGKRRELYRVPLRSRTAYDHVIKCLKKKHNIPAKTDQAFPLAATEAFDRFAPDDDPVVSALIALHHTPVTSRYFRVGLTPFQAHEYARRVGDLGMLKLIRDIDRVIPPQEYGMLNGVANPNNGNPHHVYEIGREYSPVVYVVVHTTYLNNNLTFYAFNNAIRHAGKAYNADEVHITQDEGTWTARLWWD